MITFRFSGRTPSPSQAQIGMETDQNSETLRFLLPQVAEHQSAQLMMILPDGTPEALQIRDGLAVIPSSVTETPGRSRCWVEILGDGGIAWNSELLYLEVGDLPPISEETERTYPTAIQDAMDAAARAEDAAHRAEDAGSIAETIVNTHLDPVTVYDIAVAYGFQGTQEEWAEQLAHAARQEDLDALAADVYYTALAINSFTATPSEAEMGSTVTAVALAFAMNKIPNVMTLDGVPQTPAKSGTINQTGLSLTANQTWTLHAEDNGSPTHQKATPTKTAALTFLNRVYYGAAEIPGTLNSEFLLGLSNKPLTDTKARTFAVNAETGEYIWYAVPKRFGACSFTVGKFPGGFDAAQEISVTNASGYTEAYYVYHSTNAGIGKPKVIVE